MLALLLQISLFASPLYLDERVPESRSARALLVAVDPKATDAELARKDSARLALELAGQLRAGAEFDALKARANGASSLGGGAMLGTVFPGMLAQPIDDFLFHAAELEVSQPIESGAGFQIVQRLERLAGCRTIFVAGSDDPARARIAGLVRELSSGADFAELASKHSEDPLTAARGGALGIFERGPSDMLLKAAAFELKVGTFGGPIESPLGLHLVQRVDPASIDASLADDTVARVRLILIAFGAARGAGLDQTRDLEAAEKLARELVLRIKAGEDMAELAAVHDDDRGGRGRRGDLGWIRRRSSQIPSALDRAFSMDVGELAEPLRTDAGWLVLRRER